MKAVDEFGFVVLLTAGGAAALLAAAQVTHRLPLPGAAFFLLGAAAVSNLLPHVRHAISIPTVERIAVVALIPILLDGGMKVGWHRFRSAFVPIVLLGVVATAGTAALVAVAAHTALGLDWVLAGILGGSLAPTDPAVMFSVLRGRRLRGRASTVLEGESGINDPVAIAIVIGLIGYAEGERSLLGVLSEFALQMGVGAAVGAAVGSVLPFLLRHARFASDGLYDIAALVAAALAYGVASVAHGSGFLAVFIVGILLGAERTPRKGELERSAEALASFAEMATFTALGLTIDLTNLTAGSIWLDGLLLSVLLVAIRPAVVLPLLAPLRVGSRERFFISLAGMKGAVSILLAAAAVEAGYEPKRIYGIVFLAVLFSVISQGGTVRHLASGLLAPPREENEASRERHTVARRSRAEGVALRDLPLGPRVWIEGIDRGGQPVAPRGRSVLEPGDVVIVRSDGPRPARRVRRLLEEPRAARQT